MRELQCCLHALYRARPTDDDWASCAKFHALYAYRTGLLAAVPWVRSTAHQRADLREIRADCGSGNTHDVLPSRFARAATTVAYFRLVSKMAMASISISKSGRQRMA